MRMQLKRPSRVGDVRLRLMAASCALLGAGAGRAQQASPAPADSRLLEDWTVDSALAYYHEDGRIQAIEPVVDATKLFADGQQVALNVTFDSLSGSSPNGALPSRAAQTFASPSGTNLITGRHRYTTAPGALPGDPNYQDQRVAASGDWTLPVTRSDELTVGGKLSAEDDFYSATVSAQIAHDFNEKNTTLAVGLSDEFDSIHPIGGSPVPGSNYDLFEKTGAKTKDGVGGLIGLTQVMTRTWLTELNVSIDRFKGYLNDPYKITSLIDAAGNTSAYVYESRPDQRLRKSAYWDNRIAWSSRFSSALSLRYMADDWGVRSDTAQARLRWTLGGREQYIEPTFRWYRQTAADFYTPFILAGEKPSGAYESSDTRLGAFHALTYGVKYAHTLPGLGSRPESELNIRAEYYQQTPVEHRPVPAGLQGLDLYPDLKAILVQIGWRF
jgi:Protein of unknown function (DUF3570)